MWQLIKKSIRSLPVWMGLVIVALVLMLHVISLAEDSRLSNQVSRPLQQLDTSIYDFRFQLLPPSRPEGATPVVVVDIDEDSIRREGRWPWSRSKVAALVQSLEKAGVSLIGFDVVFSEAESNPVDQMLTDTTLSPAARAEISTKHTRFDS
ncbi:MAG TPA: CHASE2 domain-containing protein, partial [Moraxellaceae bacterium]|nr:CHASE2 domain-containing protein [Moraxellaceae bacterium]